MTYEYVGNLHIHTPYSDGHGTHDEIALAAIKAELDFVVVTDHNIWVNGMDGYRYLDRHRVLLLTGEELHDRNRIPQKNHLLAYEAQCELAPYADNPQRLIDTIQNEGGLSFIAHPIDPELSRFNEPDLSWVDWEVDGFTGLEIWNFMSEFKSHLRSIPAALFYAYFPSFSSCGPYQEVLDRWDRMLAEGKHIVGIGGADAHAIPYRLGPLTRVIFPYGFLFKTVNTHVLMDEPFSGDVQVDRRRLFHNIRNGHCFIGYDLPQSTRGFRFIAHGDRGDVGMGESIDLTFGITLQVSVPQKSTIRLIREGFLVREWLAADNAVHTVSQPGAYRVEILIEFRGKSRTWILSNPIYVHE